MTDKKISIFSFTKKGGEINIRLMDILKENNISSYTLAKYLTDKRMRVLTDLKEKVKNHFSDDAIIFVGATGIAIRSISGYVKDKFSDPAILVIDELGRYVIPLLSGHVGGANELAEYIGAALGATPIITTATDINGAFAVDVFAKKHDLILSSRKLAKDVSATLLDGKPVDIDSDIKDIDISGIREKLNPSYSKCDLTVRITDKIYDENVLTLIYKDLYIGVGCKKNTDIKKMQDFIYQVFRDEGLDIRAIKAIGSIDIKKDERAIVELSNSLSVPFYTFTKDELQRVEGEFNESDFVKETVGVGNVCERAVLIQCDNLVLKKTAKDGMTLAIGRS